MHKNLCPSIPWYRIEVVHKLSWQDFHFFWPPTPCIDDSNGMNVDKKWTFLDHLPTSSCQHSLWTTPYLFEYGRNENELWDLATFINLCQQHDCRNNKKIKKAKSCKNYVVCDSVTKTGVCKLFFRCQIALALCHQRYELYNKSHNMRVKHCYNARTYKRILL